VKGRAGLLVPLAAVLVLATPGPARAHAGFISSQPEPGSTLGSAPGVVTLEFSEPLNQKLSRASVTAPDGQTFDGVASGNRAVRVPVSTNLPGIYRVEWTTVSTVDGHTLRGSFEFGVGVSPGEGAEGTVWDEPAPFDLLIAVGRTVEDAALLLAVGMLVVGGLGRRAGAAGTPLGWVRLRLRPALVVALLAGTSVIVGEALLAAPPPSAGAVVTYLTTGLTGVARLTRPFVEAAALVLSFVGVRAVVLPLVGALVLLSAAGHAAVVRPAWWGIGVEAVHLVSAGVWGGGILALASLRPSGGWLGPEGRRLLERFSPVALAAFGLTAAAGTIRGVQEVGSIRDLFTSSYGLVLLAKVLVVAIMVQLSVLAWRRLLGAPRLEAGLVLLVVAAAALLAAFPLPPARVTAALEGSAEATASRTGLPRDGDLTLGDHAGQVLVGLTLRPGAPGPNEVLLYLLPLEGEQGASGLRAEVTVDGRPLPLEQCGRTCRQATAGLEGGERLAVRVAGPTGGTAVFRLPELPAPGGDAPVEQMMDRMHRLTSYRLDETLSSGLAVVRSTYAFQAPDRVQAKVMQASGGSETIWVGSARYQRKLPSGAWAVEKGGPPPKVPSFIWDFFRPFLEAHIVGAARVEGVPVKVVAFFGDGGGLPVWFRLWIDPQGLVHRAEMRAQGHFMDHRYFDFDQPARITPPNVGEGS
jgi:copper transport protein